MNKNFSSHPVFEENPGRHLGVLKRLTPDGGPVREVMADTAHNALEDALDKTGMTSSLIEYNRQAKPVIEMGRVIEHADTNIDVARMFLGVALANEGKTGEPVMGGVPSMLKGALDVMREFILPAVALRDKMSGLRAAQSVLDDAQGFAPTLSR